MKRFFLFAFSILSIASSLTGHAAPVISGSTVTFPSAAGWYQIQEFDWSNVCQNGAGQACTGIPNGSYYVTNLNTAQRWTITVGDVGSAPIVSGSSITFPTIAGWYQIQRMDWSNVCQDAAGKTCNGIPNGTYYVTNLSTAQRWTATVGADSGDGTGDSEPQVNGSAVTFPEIDGWYQIQKHDWSNVCQNGAGKTCNSVPDGEYYVTNLSTAQRWNITVGGGALPEIAAINTVVENELLEQNVLGGAVAVVQNGAIVHARGYGFTSPARTTAVTADTVFRWASISKSLTAVATLQLDEQTNNFTIDDLVNEHVAGWPANPADNRSDITVEQLLSHRSGIIHYNNACAGNSSPAFDRTVHGDVPFNADNAVDVFRDQALCFDPGTDFEYSTFGFSLAAAAMEAEAGQSHTDWVINNIANPLNMTSLTQATETSTGFNGGCDDDLSRATEGAKSYVLPGGGWASNIADLARFANGILQGSLLGDTARLWTRNPGNTNAYRLGLNVSLDGSRSWHDGRHADLRTFMHLYHGRADDVGIVVYLNNADSDPELVAKLVANAMGVASWGVTASTCP